MPAVLQKLMRHASIETTMKFYVDLDADELADGLWDQYGDGRTSGARTCARTRPRRGKGKPPIVRDSETPQPQRQIGFL
jgi:hypothetical protein